MQKKQERVSYCPQSVSSLIFIANLLPFDFEFPYIGFPQCIEEDKKKFYEITSTLPKQFINSDKLLNAFFNGLTESYSDKPGWVSEETWQDSWHVQWVEREQPYFEHTFSPLTHLSFAISNAINIRKSLLKAIEYNKHRYGDFFPLAIRNEAESSSDSEFTASFRTNYVNKKEIHIAGFEVLDGVITVKLDTAFTVLVNEKIDTRRIKQCSNCKNFFWAKRLNKNTENEVCENCSNKLRQKRFAEKNNEAVKLKRRENYYCKKGIPYCEKCIRPNTKCGCYMNERRNK